MRFAYIDSHGNEVPIPSVDALALRIELGAVGPETQLYDAQADHWGPAKAHEIFHSLSREADDEGFVAPPPPVAPPPAAASGSAPSVPPPEAPPDAPATEEEEPPSGEFDLGLTLADPSPAPPEPEGAGGGEREEMVAEDRDEVDLDLAAQPAAGVPDGPEPDGRSDAEEEAGAFDFGDLGTELELEDLPVGKGGDEMQLDAPPEPGEGATQLESPMDFTTDGIDTEAGGDDLLLETPMSQYEPDSPPGWADEPAEGVDDVMDFSTVAAETATEDDTIVPPKDAPARQRRTPKDRPSAPKFKRERSLSGPIVFVVVLLALGVGGYVGWPIVSARLAERSAPERPPVVLPDISPELLTRMQALAGAAIVDVIDQVAASTTGPGVPQAPDEEWLAGVYLGNASRFPGIEAFWTGMGEFVGGLRSGDWQSYHDALLERIGNEGLSEAEAAIVVERADSGFVAAADDRAAAYDTMEQLVFAALDLHDFLIDNEEGIEYQPASASTVDPVLEAVPSTPQLREQMVQFISDYTDALDTALGSVDRATRDRLVSAMTARLQEVGIR